MNKAFQKLINKLPLTKSIKAQLINRIDEFSDEQTIVLKVHYESYTPPLSYVLKYDDEDFAKKVIQKYLDTHGKVNIILELNDNLPTSFGVDIPFKIAVRLNCFNETLQMSKTAGFSIVSANDYKELIPVPHVLILSGWCDTDAVYLDVSVCPTLDLTQLPLPASE